MIIVVQSLDFVLAQLKHRAEQELASEQLTGIVFTDNPETAIDHVNEGRNHPSRTIVVSSSVFEGTGTNGLILAKRVRVIDPNAWFFIFSVTPQANQNVDGVIPKESPDMYTQLMEFLGLNFDQIESLDALRQQLSWLNQSNESIA